MHWLASLCALTVLSHFGAVQGAQIPSELAQDFHTDENLIATFENGEDVVNHPGKLLPTRETQECPDVYIPDRSSKPAPFLLLMVDPSYNATVPTNVVLHTIAGNLTAAQVYSNGSGYALDIPKPVIAPYVGPEPQANTPTHNYTIMVFSQPDDFTIPSKYDQWLPLNESNPYTRTNFPLTDFAHDTGLEQPIAATYFRLALTSSTTSSKSSTPAAQAASTSSTPNTAPITSIPKKKLLEALLPTTSLYFLI